MLQKMVQVRSITDSVNNRTITYLILGVVFPLLLGGALYYLLAPEVYFVRVIDNFLTIEFHFDVDLRRHGLIRLIRYYSLDLFHLEK